MDVLKMLANLRAERQRLEEAILVIERLAARVGGKRLGRPPKWMSAMAKKPLSATPSRKKRAISDAVRKRMAAGQRKRWAAARAKARRS